MDPLITGGSSRIDRFVRLLRWIVVPGALLFVPVYLMFRLGGSSSDKLKQLPDLIGRIKNPIVWEVPEKGVRYAHFYHAPADSGDKFVLIRVRLKARIRMGFPLTPKCFKVVDDRNIRYFPLSRSPLFIQYGDSIRLDRGTVIDGDLLFEIPQDSQARNLLFERYQP